MSQASRLSSTHKLVWVCLLAALTSVSAFFQIPLWPAPITLQTMFVLLAGLILGSGHGSACILLYILLGSVGFPVFSGGKAGWAILLGPTGGYLAGFVLSALLCGLGAKKFAGSKTALFLLCATASILTLFCGSLRLIALLDYSPGQAFLVGLLPFFIGDLLKSVAAVGVFLFLKKHKLVPS